MEFVNIPKTITALKTVFDVDGSVSIKKTIELTQRQIDNGINGIVVAGTTGEGHLLSWDEQIELTQEVTRCFKEKLYIIACTGSNSTREAAYGTEKVFEIGVDATLQVNPYYGHTNDDGLLSHFKKLINIGPAILYNVPKRTGQSINDKVILELSKESNFVGIKECLGYDRIERLSKAGIRVWSGDDSTYINRIDEASYGVISVASNIIPLHFKLLESKACTASQFNALQKTAEVLTLEPNPIVLTYILIKLGMIPNYFRSPYAPPCKQARNQIDSILELIREHI